MYYSRYVVYYTYCRVFKTLSLYKYYTLLSKFRLEILINHCFLDGPERIRKRKATKKRNEGGNTRRLLSRGQLNEVYLWIILEIVYFGKIKTTLTLVRRKYIYFYRRFYLMILLYYSREYYSRDRNVISIVVRLGLLGQMKEMITAEEEEVRSKQLLCIYKSILYF